MEGYIDMHCHILPQVDDGSSSMEETKKMLRIALDEGISRIIATPHHHPIRGHEPSDVLQKKLQLVQEAAREINEQFRIYLGTEIYFLQNVPAKLLRGEILTMNRKSHVLLEFSPSDSYHYIRQSIQQVQGAGYQVILAHVERYGCLLSCIEFVKQLWDMGVDMQINADSIAGGADRKVRRFVRKLMALDMVFGVGTDAHSCGRRPPKMKAAARYVKRKYGADYMRRIFFSNAAKLLEKEEKE